MMIFTYLIIIFLLTIIGGGIPLVFKNLTTRSFDNMLIFSGVFLLGISIFHLFPESWAELKWKTLVFVFIGFFAQMSIQKFVPALRHKHGSEAHSSWSFLSHTSVILGLGIHAFIEGIPLGYGYNDPFIALYLTLAISYHKIPEAFAMMTIVSAKKKSNFHKWLLVISFATITPISALLATYTEQQLPAFTTLLQYLVALVIGSFIYVSITILIEGGIKFRHLTLPKIISVVLGIIMVAGTFFFG